MHNRLGAAPLLWAFLVAASSAAKAQPPADSATLQIRQTTFAPWLKVDLASSYQTWSGTFVRDLLPGHGSPQGLSSKVRIKFRMWLADGTPLLNPSDTASFVIGRGVLIRGLEEGVMGMRLGGLRQLVMRSVAGWGLAARPEIPANAVLVAEVSLIEVAYDAARSVR